MLIAGKPYRTIWPTDDGVTVIDQRHLPFELVVEELRTWRDMVTAIRDMHVRGAPLIGLAGAYGAWLACREYEGLGAGARLHALKEAMTGLESARPTAVNLRWAITRMRAVVDAGPDPAAATRAALATANAMADADVAACRAMGDAGLPLIEEAARRKPGPVRILTHCNAGWLATVDLGTATSPIYGAVRRGIPVEVWVDETRPRNQGALTAWELGQNGVPCTVICDNEGGHLMQRGLVDMVIVGTDRTAANGDVANKIGTYLKALAARDNGVPFYVALPSASFDADTPEGVGLIPIEERSADEVLRITGRGRSGMETVSLFAEGTRARNDAFDVTPACLVSGYITDRGLLGAGDLIRVLGSSGTVGLRGGTI